MENSAFVSLVIGVVCVDINLIHLYPYLAPFIVAASALILTLSWGFVDDIKDMKKDTKDTEDTEDSEDADDTEDASSEDVQFEGITYEMNIIDLFDVIFERLREKMYGKVTTVNADEVREVFMAAYNVTTADTVTMDAIECIVDMVICCIEIIEEAGSSAAPESPHMSDVSEVESPAEAEDAPAQDS
jgi:hypothetical protein